MTIPTVSTSSSFSVNQIDQAIAIVNRADALLKRGQYEESSRMLEEVKAMMPDLPEVNYMLALAYQKQGRLRKALVNALEEYLNNPENLRIRQLTSQINYSRINQLIPVEFPGKKVPASCPSLSLIMIVRNEEDNLARCLDSIKDIVTEMIIVDTGSTDRTVEIARSYGAKVYFFEWCDDFAAARNESIRHATGEWLLMMDADNWLKPVDQVRIQEAAASGKYDAYICKQLSMKDGHVFTQDKQFRLFRNGLGLMYRGSLHENIDQSLISRSLMAGDTNIIIQHAEFLSDDQATRTKLERNYRVIEKALEKDPKDFGNRILQVDILHGLWHKDEEAANLFERILQELPDQYCPNIYLRDAYVPLLNKYARTGQKELFRQTLHSFLADGMETLYVWTAGGQGYLNYLDDPQKALTIFERALGLESNDRDKAVLKVQDTDEHLLKLLARASTYAGQKEKAFQHFKTRKRMTPAGKVLKQLGKAADLLAMRKYQEVLDLLSPFLFQDGKAARLLAEAAAGMQDWQFAASAAACGIVLASQPTAGDWLSLAQYEMNAGFTDCAIRACQMGLDKYPEHAALLLACGKAAIKKSNTRLAIECLVQAVLFSPDQADQNSIIQSISYEKQAAGEMLQSMADHMGVSTVQLMRSQGVAWVKSKAYAKARAALSHVAQAAPGDQQVSQMLAMLDKLV